MAARLGSRAKGSRRHTAIPNLGRLMRLRGWTQKDLAHAAGMPHAFVNQVFTGRRSNPTSATIARLGQAFYLPRHVLLNDGLSDADLRSAMSRGALREVERRGVALHGLAIRLLDTSRTPLSVEEWLVASEVLVLTRARG